MTATMTTACPSWCTVHDDDHHESPDLDVLAGLSEPLPALMWLATDERGPRIQLEVETMPSELTADQARQMVAALTAALGILEAGGYDPADEDDKRPRIDGSGAVWRWRGSLAHWEHVGQELAPEPSLAAVAAVGGALRFYGAGGR